MYLDSAMHTVLYGLIPGQIHGMTHCKASQVLFREDTMGTLLLLMQGAIQCCMTGPAFEQMLRLKDAAVVETVMGSVAVFARMRSDQKGQVMGMLSLRGIYQNVGSQMCHMPVRLTHFDASCSLPAMSTCTNHRSPLGVRSPQISC